MTPREGLLARKARGESVVYRPHIGAKERAKAAKRAAIKAAATAPQACRAHCHDETDCANAPVCAAVEAL